MGNRFISVIGIFAAALLAFPPIGAVAAPQILGLVASAEPIPLTCENGICMAELTTVCLQEHRPAPMPGTAYRASAITQITLAVAGPEGHRTSVDITGQVSFNALRNIASVAISLPEATVRQFGSGEPAISVGAMAAVVPVVEPGDKQPQSAYEIETYTGTFRAIAGEVFDRNETAIGSLRLLNQVINRLPDESANESAAFAAVWRDVVEKKAQAVSPEGQRQLAEVAATCRKEVEHGMLPSLKSCVADQHDALASETTKKVWRVLRPNG